MDAGTNGLADAEVWWMSIRRMSTTASPDLKNALLTGSELVDTHIPFLAERYAQKRLIHHEQG
jgi:hypothetical protein